RSIAETTAPEITLAQGRGEVARAEIEVAGARPNPTLSASTARETARLGTSLSVPLALFGQRAAVVEAAHSDADVAQLDVEAARLDARFSATTTWIDLWEAQERARLLADAARDADRVASIAEETYR